MYYRTYCDGKYKHFWKAIFKSCKLFRIVGMKVAEEFQYEYHFKEEKNMLFYLSKVKKLPKDAKEINM
jgi:aminoglycoside 6-adenylyltransferase